MANAIVRRVGNTLMLEIPSDIEHKLHLIEGSQVELEGGQTRLTVRSRNKYSLDDLLARCDFRNR